MVVTTHSAPIIVPMSEGSLRFIVRDRSSVSVQSDVPSIVFRNLGIDPPMQVVILAEDDLGCAFAKALLEKFEPRLARSVEVIFRGGEGNVVNSLRHMPDTERLRFLGMLDGDMRGKLPVDVAERCLFLPGDEPMEKIFRQMVSSNPQSLIDVTGSNRIVAIIAGLEGRDYHDWLDGLAAELGYSKSQLLPLMFGIWLRAQENLAAARECIASLHRALDPVEELEE